MERGNDLLSAKLPANEPRFGGSLALECGENRRFDFRFEGR
jgi:hypothetical protein